MWQLICIIKQIQSTAQNQKLLWKFSINMWVNKNSATAEMADSDSDEQFPMKGILPRRWMPPFPWEDPDPYLIQSSWTHSSVVTPTPMSHKSSAVAEMGDRLATKGMGRKWGEAAVGAGSPLGPHLTQCGLGRGLPLYQVASWSIQPFGHNCRNATLLRVGIRLRTIFIPSLDVKTFTGCVHWVIARYQLNSSK